MPWSLAKAVIVLASRGLFLMNLIHCSLGTNKYQFITQPEGWVGPIVHPAAAKLTNLRQDPFERMNWPSNGFAGGSVAYYNVYKHEMWRLQIPGKVIAEYLPTLIEYPPMQEGASFNIGDLKEKVKEAIAASKATGD